MKKKILSMALAAVLAVSCSAAVIAEDKAPIVSVDTREIIFNDQEPVILGEGTTLVPARGVFEAMGAEVTWDGEKELVEVTSADGQTLIRLTIDNSTMTVYDLSGMFGALISGQDFKAPETPVTLDVAPQIMNERTMIPLRAISEALEADVDFVPAADANSAHKINITTKDTPAVQDGIPELSLSADALAVNEGEEISIYVDAKNIPEGLYVSGITAAVKYEKEKFELVSATLCDNEKDIAASASALTPDFADEYLKASYLTHNIATAAKTDGHVMKITFKSLTGEEGSFQLSNGYHTEVGYNTTLLVNKDANDYKTKTYEGDDIKIDQTVLKINDASATPVATVSPSATPAATVEPTATVDPSATPAATVDPKATVEPTATPAATVDPKSTATPTTTPVATVEPTATPAA